MVAESLYRWFSLTLHIYGTWHSPYFQFCDIINHSLVFVFNNLFVSPPFSKLYFCVLKWSFDWRVGVLQKCNFGFFPSYPGDVDKGFRFAILDGGMERWSLFDWKYIYVIQDTPVMGFVLVTNIFFCLDMNKKFCLTKEELWVKTWQPSSERTSFL